MKLQGRVVRRGYTRQAGSVTRTGWPGSGKARTRRREGRLYGGPEGSSRQPREVPPRGGGEGRQGRYRRHPPLRRGAADRAAGVRAIAGRAERRVEADRQIERPFGEAGGHRPHGRAEVEDEGGR